MCDLHSPALTEFVTRHRDEIDLRIRALSPDFAEIDDRDRRLWVLTIDELKLWAGNKGLII